MMTPSARASRSAAGGGGRATVGEPDVDVLAKPFSETALVEQVRHRIGDA